VETREADLDFTSFSLMAAHEKEKHSFGGNPHEL